METVRGECAEKNVRSFVELLNPIYPQFRVALARELCLHEEKGAEAGMKARPCAFLYHGTARKLSYSGMLGQYCPSANKMEKP